MSTIDYAYQRHWEDVEVGETLAELHYDLDWTAMVLQVSGSQDWSPIHHDFDFAKDSGMDTIFYNTGWTIGVLGKVLTDWAGPSGWVEKLGFQMRGMNQHGCTVTVGAKVSGTRMEDGKGLVDLEIFVANDLAGVTTPGTAIVSLPLKSSQ
ncbi:MAG: hypothetical protein AB8C02_15470 [Halioglobus sp.]